MNYAEEIRKLAEEKGALILAHNYQPAEIQDLADITGDSLELARKAKDAEEKLIVMCGVYFMAETAKILSHDKTVLCPRVDAGCPLAEQLTPELVKQAKKKYFNAPFVVYVNSTAETKAVCDITCTSANAAEIVESLESNTVLFGPDKNLAEWVQRKLPDKTIIPVPSNGGCPTHHKFTVEDVDEARKKYPKATIICHPECSPDVQNECDLIGSTGYMMRNCGEKDEWVIFTEKGIIHPLTKKYPDKIFHVIDSAVCPSMKFITPEDLYISLRDETTKIEIPEKTAASAKKAIEKMIEISK